MSANLIGIGGIQAAEGKAVMSRRQGDKAVDLMSCGLFAFFGRGLAGVADGTFGVEVLRDPAEGMGACRAEMGELCSMAIADETKFFALSMLTRSGRNDSISEVSMSPAWMPWRASTASYMPFGSPNQRQCVGTTSIAELTRNSRATVASTDALPP